MCHWLASSLLFRPNSLLLCQHICLLEQFISKCKTRAHFWALEGVLPSCIKTRLFLNHLMAFVLLGGITVQKKLLGTLILHPTLYTCTHVAVEFHKDTMYFLV